MYTERRLGALAVLEQARDSSWVQRELRKIDDRLFCERQVAFDGAHVWCVVVDVGLDQPPITLLEWRDEAGRPLDLSSGIVDRMTRMERDGSRLSARVIQANRDLLESRRRQQRDDYQQLAEEHRSRFNPINSPLLHRGVSLRMMRDRQRAQGRRV